MPVLAATLSVFAVVAVGVVLRRVHVLTPAADTPLLKLTVNVLMPCLIFDRVLSADALRVPANVWLPPLVGFGTTAAGIGVALLAARTLGPRIGLPTRRGQRTFALAAGLHNYGYLAIPLAGALYPSAAERDDVLGVLFVNNVGVDVAMWTVGVMVVSGAVGVSGLRRAVNPPVLAVFVALGAFFTGGRSWLPAFAQQAAALLADAAVPVALVMIGTTMHDAWTGASADPADRARPATLGEAWRTAAAGCVLRLGLLPLVFVAAAAALPLVYPGPAGAAAPLRGVLVLHAAMPSAIFPIVLARFYGGDPAVATRVALATGALSLVTIPLWIAALG